MEQTNQLSRRKFIKISGVTGAVLAIGYTSGYGFTGGHVTKYALEDLDAIGLNDFIFIDQTGKVTLVNHRPEMGQGVYQAMPMLIAEELEVKMEEIDIIQSQADNKKYGHQQVGGSSSVRKSWEPSRKIGAAARMMLIAAAASKWNVSPSDCIAENGIVKKKNSDHSFTYGELVSLAATLEAPTDPTLKSPDQFKILGKPSPRKDIPFKTNGKAEFGLDVKIPEMVFASIERNPVFLGKVSSFNKQEVEALPGVIKVIKSSMPVFSHQREGVAIIAKDYYSALNARKKLKVVWDNNGVEQLDQSEIFEKLKTASEAETGFVEHDEGQFETELAKAEKRIIASYELPYQSHATMEPMNCVVQVKDGKCTCWGAIQSPNWIKGALAGALDMKPENVTVNISFLGGGFGRRAFTDFSIEAALLSKAMDGKPVKVVWKREDDNTQGPFRPGTVSRLRAGISNGKLIALQHQLATQAIGHQWPGADSSEAPKNVLEGINTQYSVANHQTKVVPVAMPMPVMWWRSVYASTNSFAHESFIDELALELDQDPIAFRISLLQEEPRFIKVLEKAAKESGWNDNRENKGIAIVKSFGSICAHVVEMHRENGQLKVKQVTSVMDCGLTVNPDTIKAQTEGNVVMALTAAFKSGISFKNGQVVEKNFNTYHMLRMDECPPINVHIMSNTEAPGGVGEPGLPPLAPALTNAIFAMTKKRIRKLPFELKAY